MNQAMLFLLLLIKYKSVKGTTKCITESDRAYFVVALGIPVKGPANDSSIKMIVTMLNILNPF